MSIETTDITELCVRATHLMVDGTGTTSTRSSTRERQPRGQDEPPECRGRGPAAFYATALWLRAAFDDLASRSTTSSCRR